MNLERHRKAAKRLLRTARADAPEANARLAAVLGDRARAGIQLSDALHVIAREQGYRSWPELKSAYASVEAPVDPARIETTIETGSSTRPEIPCASVWSGAGRAHR